ncbi:MAG: phenylacetic acid degradation protein [Acidovorax sp.]|nr:MAG: phenylacetic acid degradation protein [Acidovorax sp.]
MGVVLQILGLVITFTMAMEALRRFGIDVGWLNPLTFFHRRAWRKKVQTPPLYALDHPVDVVAVLALATVQTTGAITVQQKSGVQALLQEHLKLSESDAGSLWLASAHLLRSRALDVRELPALLERSADKFTDYHVQTLQAVMRGAAMVEPPINAAQQQLIDAVNAYFAKKNASSGPWSS